MKVRHLRKRKPAPLHNPWRGWWKRVRLAWEQTVRDTVPGPSISYTIHLPDNARPWATSTYGVDYGSEAAP